MDNSLPPVSAFLAPFSWIYSIALRWDRHSRSRKSVSLNHPVISIGNLTTGGTGKTPLIIKLAEDLLTLGISPGILTRGYRGIGKKAVEQVILRGDRPGDELSDEVALMARRLPTVAIGIGGNRIKSASAFEAIQKVDAFLLDDGFQHWPIRRDLDIVCLDCTDPWGGGRLLPWGRLREPISNLSRAQCVVLTRGELISKEDLGKLKVKVGSLAPSAQMFCCSFETQFVDWDGRALEGLPKGGRFVALSAIGNPRAFEKAIEKWGPVTPLRYRDHHLYGLSDVERAAAMAAREGAIIVTTEKDFVKLKSFRWPAGSPRVALIRPRFEPSDEARWKQMIKAVARRHEASV